MQREESSIEAEVSLRVARLGAMPLIASGLAVLREAAPDTLFFHTISHAEDVLHEAVLFALHDRLDDREIELLALAAAYHDAGYVRGGGADHELFGANMAAEAMRREGGYTEIEVEQVRSMIMDTKLQTEPGKELHNFSSDLSKYLLDADLSNFGRNDFFARFDDCLKETKLPRQNFLEQTLRIMNAHDWLTPAARTLRGPKKRENMRAIELQLEKK